MAASLRPLDLGEAGLQQAGHSGLVSGGEEGAAAQQVDLAAPDDRLVGAVAAVDAVLALLRLSRWHGERTLGRPILGVLHL